MGKPKLSSVKLCFEPSKLPTDVLPTKDQVIRAICFEKDVNENDYSVGIRSVSKEVIALWEKAMLPIVTPKRVGDKLSQYFEKYREIKKAVKSSATQQQLKGFKVCQHSSNIQNIILVSYYSVNK